MSQRERDAITALVVVLEQLDSDMAMRVLARLLVEYAADLERDPIALMHEAIESQGKRTDVDREDHCKGPAPAPWHLHVDGPRLRVRAQDGGGTVCTMGSRGDDVANGRLIAAAPEVYEAAAELGKVMTFEEENFSEGTEHALSKLQHALRLSVMGRGRQALHRRESREGLADALTHASDDFIATVAATVQLAKVQSVERRANGMMVRRDVHIEPHAYCDEGSGRCARCGLASALHDAWEQSGESRLPTPTAPG